MIKKARNTYNVIAASSARQSALDLRIYTTKFVAHFHNVAPATFNHVNQLDWKRLEILVPLAFAIQIFDKLGV